MFRKETEYITPYLSVLIQNSDKHFSNETFPFSFWVNENSKFNWVDYWQRSTVRYLISTTPKECRYRFTTAHWERISLGITLLTIVTIQKNEYIERGRMEMDSSLFVALCVCLCGDCGWRREHPQHWNIVLVIFASPSITNFRWLYPYRYIAF
jgi:hypothetical protein